MSKDRRERLRERLFITGVDSAKRVFGIREEIYLCPICSIGFKREHLESRILTLEHVPPKSQGGKEICLTCHSCNSTAGRTVDVEANYRERSNALLEAMAGVKDQYEGYVYLIINGEKVLVNLEVLHKNLNVQLLEELNDPELLQAVNELLPSISEKGTEITFQVKRGFHRRRARVSDLRSAYLLAFCALGYTYAFHPRLDQVRDQIEHHEETIIEGFWWTHKKLDPTEKIIAIGEKPFSFVYVKLPRSIIFLPELSGPPDFYKSLSKEISKGEKFHASGVQFDWPNGLVMALDRKRSHS